MSALDPGWGALSRAMSREERPKIYGCLLMHALARVILHKVA